jgi:hypothetical protein
MQKHPFHFIISIIMVLLINCSTVFATVKVSLHPRIYLGLGLRSAFGNKVPSFEIEDEIDQNYYNLNLSSIKKTFLHGQIRLNLIKVWQISAGYTFWGHDQQYLKDYPEFWAKDGKIYPHSHNYNLHGAVLQWDINFPAISSKYFTPFILVGVGRYFGNAKGVRFEFETFEENNIIYVTNIVELVSETKRFDGEAVFVGIGLTVLKYGYVELGYIDFRDNMLPMREFVTFIVGFTI